MTPLGEIIAARVRADGSMPIADYMEMCLGHPRHGYYTTHDPLGARGDFVTAPEVSQMFGELIGLWCADTWRRMGAPDPLRVVELGPGRGTLLADALRAAHKVVPEFARAAELHLIETSPVLRDVQRAALADARASWHETLAQVPVGPILLIANEFFDALPIRQVERTGAGWAERVVTLGKGGELHATVGSAVAAGDTLPAGAAADAPEGTVAEDCPAGRTLAGEIGRRVTRHGGAALIIDYGTRRSAPGDSLQALKAHRAADPFAQPGEADLTAHVDFAALARAARGTGARVLGPVDQGAFLSALGIEARAAALARGAAPDRIRAIEADVHRLIAPNEMGALFQVMAVTHPELGAPDGFQT